jgi:hypothetical protein
VNPRLAPAWLGQPPPPAIIRGIFTNGSSAAERLP